MKKSYIYGILTSAMLFGGICAASAQTGVSYLS